MTRTRRPAEERVEDLQAILDAIRLAVQEALTRHKQAGNPVATWIDGRVEWIRPEDIPDIPEPAGRATPTGMMDDRP
jgi:hypothetical protein